MAQEFQPGEIAPESGTYKVIHVATHANALNMATMVKGRRFPDWQCCEGVRFKLVYSGEAYRRDTSAYGHTARGLRRTKKAVPFVVSLKLVTARSGRAIRMCLTSIALSVCDTLSSKRRRHDNHSETIGA